MKVVIDDRRCDRLARDEHHVRAGNTQQRAQHPLLVMVHARDLRQLLRVEREAGNHHGPRRTRVRKYPPEQRRQPFLDLREAPKFLGGTRAGIPTPDADVEGKSAISVSYKIQPHVGTYAAPLRYSTSPSSRASSASYEPFFG